jgi:hypothetical protein
MEGCSARRPETKKNLEKRQKTLKELLDPESLSGSLQDSKIDGNEK